MPQDIAVKAADDKFNQDYPGLTFIISISNQCVNIGGGDVKRGKQRKGQTICGHITHVKKTKILLSAWQPMRIVITYSFVHENLNIGLHSQN